LTEIRDRLAAYLRKTLKYNELRKLGKDLGVTKLGSLTKKEMSEKIADFILGNRQEALSKLKENGYEDIYNFAVELMGAEMKSTSQPPVSEEVKEEKRSEKEKEKVEVRKPIAEAEKKEEKRQHVEVKERTFEEKGILVLKKNGKDNRNQREQWFLKVIKGPPTRWMDVYVSPKQVARFGLRPGDEIEGVMRDPHPGENYHSLLQIKKINRIPVNDFDAKYKKRPEFEDLTPIFPEERLNLYLGPNVLTTRIIDLFSPIGKGQRGLIVAPPKAGKTTIIKDIAKAITQNHPEVEVIILLIDERPEEVTYMKDNVPTARVIASTFDLEPEYHEEVADIVLNYAKRQSEIGRDVLILLDGITRMTRAYNLNLPASGRTLSGGLDPAAFMGPKRFFGAARNFREGGSLTILATALVETGSRMDEVIFEEFKGTGNMELVLDRKLAERRIYPAIDVHRSGTRHEEKLYSEEERKAVWYLRRILSERDNVAALQELLNYLKETKTNEEFLMLMMKTLKG